MSAPLFKTGMQCIFPYTEHGLSLYGVLESAWNMAALLEGCRKKPWEGGDLSHPVAGCWFALGLITADGKLTDMGENVVKCSALLEYEWQMMKRTLDGETETDPEMYNQLRGALETYANTYNPEIFDWVVKQVSMEEGEFLDLCGGDGMFAYNISERTDLRCHIADKTITQTAKERFGESNLHRVDILSKQGEEFTNNFAERFDCIVISEALHCMDKGCREDVFRKMNHMLAPGGCIIVVEQLPNLRLAWRMQQFSSNGGTSIPIDLCAYEGQVDQNLVIDGTITTGSHYAMKFIRNTEEH